MRIAVHLLILIAACTIAAGCQSDSDAHTTSDAVQAQADEAHVHDGPSTTTVAGRLSGFDCAVVGELCPSTHRGGDYTTGVYTEDDSFFFVVNIPHSFLTQHFLETVEIEGTVYGPYDHAVEPEAIHIVEEGDRRLVYEAGYFIDKEGRRATFREGQFRHGQWVVP